MNRRDALKTTAIAPLAGFSKESVPEDPDFVVYNGEKLPLPKFYLGNFISNTENLFRNSSWTQESPTGFSLAKSPTECQQVRIWLPKERALPISDNRNFSGYGPMILYRYRVLSQNFLGGVQLTKASDTIVQRIDVSVDRNHLGPFLF